MHYDTIYKFSPGGFEFSELLIGLPLFIIGIIAISYIRKYGFNFPLANLIYPPSFTKNYSLLFSYMFTLFGLLLLLSFIIQTPIRISNTIRIKDKVELGYAKSHIVELEKEFYLSDMYLDFFEIDYGFRLVLPNNENIYGEEYYNNNYLIINPGSSLRIIFVPDRGKNYVTELQLLNK